jgi:hypothetical protein
MKLHTLLFFVTAFMALGCSSSNSEFEGVWVLTSYTLDDGTMKSVPESIQDGGGIGIAVSSNGTFGVQHGLCESYQISYRLNNDVLTTSDPVFPEIVCAGFHADTDNAERSELLRRTFLNTQTIIAVSINLLTVTTVQNETLIFERSVM